MVYHSISQYTTVYHTVYHSIPQYITVYHSISHSISQYITQYTTVYHSILQHHYSIAYTTHHAALYTCMSSALVSLFPKLGMRLNSDLDGEDELLACSPVSLLHGMGGRHHMLTHALRRTWGNGYQLVDTHTTVILLLNLIPNMP